MEQWYQVSDIAQENTRPLAMFCGREAAVEWAKQNTLDPLIEPVGASEVMALKQRVSIGK